MKRYAVKVHYERGNCVTDEVVLPEGWEPVGGDIEDGNALRLVLVRELDETELAAREAAGLDAQAPEVEVIRAK